ncbi:hypothetical protein KAR91_18080 [Candidatus Pacearchaeota archaeon]|nr:hypothetical protein [Candidatus Pacearchaeota archaeon]
MYRTTVIDFETYFDSEYSLKRMTTEAYIRDPRFKTHCVSVYSDDGTQEVYTESIKENLEPFMDDFVITHHAHFDGLILSHHYGLYPKYWGCTLSMARGQLQFLRRKSLGALCEYYDLPEKTIKYNAFQGKRGLDPETQRMLTEGCLDDSRLTFKIAQYLLAEIPSSELQIIDSTIRMFTEPCLDLDVELITEELARVRKVKKEALENLNVDRKDLMSSKKFGTLITMQGVEVPMKYSEKQDKLIPALAKTDAGMKALLGHEDETVAALASARLGEKSTLLETRCVRLLDTHSRGGDLPVYLNYHGARHTGRWSGGDKMNWQNIIPAIKKAVLAPDGYKLVGADSAQIECRLLNWFAGQGNIVEAFREGRDIYCEGATIFFGREITKKDKAERALGKVIELGSGYGVGAPKFQAIALQQAKQKITDEEARRAIQIYRDSHPKVVGMWSCFQQVIEDMGKGLAPYKIKCLTIDGYKIIMPDGTFLDYTGLHWEEDENDSRGGNYKVGDRKIYGGLVVENIIQKLGRAVIAHVIINVDNKYGYKLATTTHDDVLYVIPEDDTSALNNILTEMKSPPDWCHDCPLDAGGFESRRYDK